MSQAGTPIVDEVKIQQNEEKIEAVKAEIENEEIAKLKAENASLKAKEATLQAEKDKRNEEATALLKASNRGTPIAGSSRRNDVQAKSKNQLTARLLASKWTMAKGGEESQKAQEVYDSTVDYAMSGNDGSYTLNSAGYISTAQVGVVPMPVGIASNKVEPLDLVYKIDISGVDVATTERVVRTVAELDYAKSDASVVRNAFANRAISFVTESAKVHTIDTSMELDRDTMDRASLDRRANIIEQNVGHLQAMSKAKKRQHYLYNTDGVGVTPMIPTINATFLSNNNVIQVTDTAIEATNGYDPYIVLHNTACSDPKKKGFFVRPLGFSSWVSGDFDIQKLFNSIDIAYMLLNTETMNQGKRPTLLIGNKMKQLLSRQRQFEGDVNSNLLVNLTSQIQDMGIDVVHLPELEEAGGVLPVAILAVFENYYVANNPAVNEKWIKDTDTVVVEDIEISKHATPMTGNRTKKCYLAEKREALIGMVRDSTAAVLFTLSA